MEPTSRPRVKICCIRSVPEAWTAVRHGASALGLVSHMPSGPGVIADEDIAAIAAAAPPPVATFLLTCRQDAASIIESSSGGCAPPRCSSVTGLEKGAYAELREALHRGADRRRVT